MRYLVVYILKAIFFLVWVVVMVAFGISLFFVHLWTFRNIHWKKVWYKFMGSPQIFEEESEDPKALLKTFLNYVRFVEPLEY